MPESKEQLHADDLATCIQVGLHAVAYMASQLHQLARSMEFVATTAATGTVQESCERIQHSGIKRLTTLAHRIDDLMQFLGDSPDLDECTQDDMESTQHAFRLMERLRAGTLTNADGDEQESAGA